MIGLAMVASAAALAPSGPWAMDSGDSLCLLTREFGQGGKAVAIGLRYPPLQGAAEFLIFREYGDVRPQEGDGRLQIGEGTPIKVRYRAWHPLNTTFRTVSVVVERAQLASLKEGAAIQFDLKREWEGEVAPTAVGAGLKALADCERRQLASWGITPGELDAMAAWPTPIDGGTWFRPRDYPAAAASAGNLGRTMALVAVDASGAVTGCRTVVSSGSPDLDKAACTVTQTRGKFAPARDRAGKPMAGHYPLNVRWDLPDW